jgi:hypothetical protein
MKNEGPRRGQNTAGAKADGTEQSRLTATPPWFQPLRATLADSDRCDVQGIVAHGAAKALCATAGEAVQHAGGRATSARHQHWTSESFVPIARDCEQGTERLSKLAIFKERCEARAILVEAAVYDLHEAVDVLQADAVESGLVADIGQDEVQAIMAEAFGRVR